MAIGRGSLTPSISLPASMLKIVFLSNQRAETISTPSTFIAYDFASAKHPIIIDEGKGQG